MNIIKRFIRSARSRESAYRSVIADFSQPVSGQLHQCSQIHSPDCIVEVSSGFAVYPLEKYTSQLKTFAMEDIFDLLFDGANIDAFKVFFPNCVLVALICVFVASYEAKDLDITLSNFAPKR